MLGGTSSCCCSVTKSCPTFCNIMDCSMSAFLVLHSLGICSNSCLLIEWCHPITFFISQILWLSGPAQQWTHLREWCCRRIRKNRLRNKVGIRQLMPLTGKSPDPNPCMPFIVNFYFLIPALQISVLYNLRWG